MKAVEQSKNQPEAKTSLAPQHQLPYPAGVQT